MAEKNYNYSNKRSYDGVATKENEALVPFLAHEVLKNYHQDIRDGIRKRNEGIIEDNFETWNIRSNPTWKDSGKKKMQILNPLVKRDA